MTPSPVSQPTNSRSRARRGLSFVAIVWAIAGSFWFCFEGQVWLSDRILRSEHIPEWVTESRIKPADCSAILARRPARPPDAASLKRARWAAWEMGLSFGNGHGVAERRRPRSRGESKSARLLRIGGRRADARAAPCSIAELCAQRIQRPDGRGSPMRRRCAGRVLFAPG